MIIRPTEEKDLDAILEIVREAQNWFVSQNIPQWIHYPTRQTFEEDMKNRTSYVLTDGEIVLGMACIMTNEELTYRSIRNGAWQNANPYVTIHRIAVRADSKGKHLAHEFIAKAVAIAKENGYTDLRADTHEKNASMRAFLKREGFVECGQITLENGDPRIGFQKLVTD